MFDVMKLISVVETTAAAFLPEYAPAVKAAEAVVALVKDVRPTLATTDQAALDAALPALLEKMSEDVDQAIKDLRG